MINLPTAEPKRESREGWRVVRWLRVAMRVALRWTGLGLKKCPSTTPRTPPDEDASGPFLLGKPVPVRPAPTHHLVAALALPPSDKTHLYPHD